VVPIHSEVNCVGHPDRRPAIHRQHPCHWLLCPSCKLQAAYYRIPEEFRSRIENIAVLVEPEFTSRQLSLARVPSGATLFGLYEGRPLTVRSLFDSFAMPDRITIFQAPHEHAARSPEHLVKLFEETIWHEVALYFGMNESQIRSATRARRNPHGLSGARG
jgi:predicted Zn-dependent protease with MMP-like domain